MNKLKFFSKTALFLTVTFFVATGCSKKGVEPDEPTPKDFTELSAHEQDQILIKEFNTRGGDYGLVEITTYKENGEVESGYNPEECERAIVISVPYEIGKDQIMKQIAPDGSCGRNYEDVKHNVITLNFANFKSVVSFYTVQKDQPQLDYINVMYFDPKQNTDPKYLVLNSFRADDLKKMQNGQPNVVGRRYKEYTFERK